MAHNLRTRIFSRCGIGGEIPITILVFTLNCFHEKLMPNFPKNLKNSILEPFWTLFVQIRAKMNFPREKGCQVLNIPIIYYRAKIWKNQWATPLKNVDLTERQTDRQTDTKEWLYRTLCRTGVQTGINKLVTNKLAINNMTKC